LIREESILNKEIKEEMNKTKFVQKTLHVESSIESYFNNLKKSFINHANKFSTYVKNCNNHLGVNYDCSSLIFMIEDNTTYGSINLHDNTHFEILKTKEFMELWINYPYVKAIILKGNVINGNYTKVYFREECLLEYKSIKDYNVKILIDT
jgi:hypothetical protein